MGTINRRTAKVELFDEDIAVDVDVSRVGSWEVVTEDSDAVTIQELILNGEVADNLAQYNDIRVEQIDRDILKRTGNKVYLEPVKLKQLTWYVDGRKVS